MSNARHGQCCAVALRAALHSPCVVPAAGSMDGGPQSLRSEPASRQIPDALSKPKHCTLLQRECHERRRRDLQWPDLQCLFRQTDTSDTVDYGGTLNVLSGGTTSNTTDYGIVNISSGGIAIGTFANYGQEYVESGGIGIGTIVKIGSQEYVESGGTAIGTVVSNGGQVSIESGGTASGTVVDSGGLEYVQGGGPRSAPS